MKTRHYLAVEVVALTLALWGMAAAAPAQEATNGGGHDRSLQSLDKNDDGFLSRSEIPKDMTLLRSRFSTYDENHDGKLDGHEFATAKDALEGGGQGNEPSSDD